VSILRIVPLRSSLALKTYTDTRKKSITLPLSDLSFADEVVSFTAGQPAARPVS